MPYNYSGINGLRMSIPIDKPNLLVQTGVSRYQLQHFSPTRLAQKGLGWGYFYRCPLPPEPDEKRVVAFFDGQNLFHAAKESFGCEYPNYDVSALALSVCHPRGWTLAQIRFYTGVHDERRDPFWHGFWNDKLTVIGHQGVSL